jgi:cellulose synthase/poly-beta-1,6-N-acetylglucosamine synthase-like glycosyltransferase
MSTGTLSTWDCAASSEQQFARRTAPAVDVIVAFHNEARLLQAKLANLHGLNYPAQLLRFILVDGQSTDGSREIAERMARTAAGVVLLRCPVADKTQQINLALSGTTAPWVLITDVDAHLPPNTVCDLLAVAEADPRVAVAGVFHRPRRTTRLDRLHWRVWNLSRHLERRTGSTSAVLAPCYLVRRGWISQLPADVIADDLYISFAALAAGRRIALANTVVVERRAPAGTLAVLVHKVRKGRAFLREVLRFLPTARHMRSPMRELFLWRMAATLVVPWVILLLVAGTFGLAPRTAGILWGGALVCCLAPVERLVPWRRGRSAVTVIAVVGLALTLAGVLCLALASMPFFPQRASFLRWRQEET